ncbi:MAG: membrane protein [Candidatus Dojkabacteria bacterium]|nr:MAG: membrane protein [Candidatus Dojkabacteria bacterium]
MSGLLFLVICFGLILLGLIASSVKIVNQQSVMVVETFGKFSRVLYPGINFIIPVIQQVRAVLNLYLQNLDVKIVAITSDKVTVVLDATLVYKIREDKVAEAYYAVGDPIAVMKSTIENSIRSYVANQTHEEILQKRDELTQYLTDHLKDRFEEWGRMIYAFQIKDVSLPEEITSAMSKVIASKRLQEAAEFEANANKILKIKAAEADREARRLSGLGVAEERSAIIDGLKSSVENMQNATGADISQVMNIVMLTQYMDTLKTLGNSQNSKIIFVNANPGSIDEIMQNIYSYINSANKSHRVTTL